MAMNEKLTASKSNGGTPSASDRIQSQPRAKCPLIGADGNIFNLLGMASRTLRENGMREQAKEMQSRVTASGSYSEALNILGEYVEICSAEEMNEEPDEGMSMM